MLIDAIQGNISMADIIIYIISASIVIFLTLPVHEWAHGFAAYKLGDNTAKYMGRLSFNPLRHIDYIGALMILVFGFGWAKPVPVDPRYFKNPKRDMALTALAGPLSNIIMAFIALFLYSALAVVLGDNNSVIAEYIWLFFYFVAYINISLAVFNLVPIPPLDGSKILSAILPTRTYYKLMQYERYSFIILAVLLYSGVLSKPLGYISSHLFIGLFNLASLPFSLLGL